MTINDSNPSVLNTGSGEVVAIYDYETYAPPSSNGDGDLNFIGMQVCLSLHFLANS